MNESLTYRLSADTHPGMQRSGNQDTFALFELPGCDAAFVVADGMGGLQDGERASHEAVLVIERTLQEKVPGGAGPAEMNAALREAFRRANDAVLQLTRPAGTEEPTQDFDRPDAAAAALMGTTAVVGVVKDGALYLAHAGDSRAYRLRAGTLERLTEDHSFVAERVKAGDMTEAEARRSRYRNMITRAIGIDRTINPDLRTETLQPGDQFLICSDGLTTMLEDEEIGRQLATGVPPERQVPLLIDAANRRGGHDNITVLVLSALRPGEILAPQVLRPVEPPVAAPPVSLPSATPPDVLDMDARPRSRSQNSRRKSAPSPSPLTSVLAVLGAGALLLLFAIVLSDTLRVRLADRLSGRLAETKPVKHLDKMEYEAPEKFYEEHLARNDRLAYVEPASLYFVNSSKGSVYRLDTNNKSVSKPLAQIPVPDKTPPEPDAPAPADEVYFATDIQGNLYLASPRRRVIEKFSRAGAKLKTIETGSESAPHAVAVDEDGNIYFVDQGYIYQVRARPATSTASPKG